MNERVICINGAHETKRNKKQCSVPKWSISSRIYYKIGQQHKKTHTKQKQKSVSNETCKMSKGKKMQPLNSEKRTRLHTYTHIQTLVFTLYIMCVHGHAAVDMRKDHTKNFVNNIYIYIHISHRLHLTFFPLLIYVSVSFFLLSFLLRSFDHSTISFMCFSSILREKKRERDEDTSSSFCAFLQINMTGTARATKNTEGNVNNQKCTLTQISICIKIKIEKESKDVRKRGT